jgi:hypothetical protein
MEREMKVSQGDERPVVRALQFRAGTTHLRHLLDGEVGTRGNFMLGIWKSEGDFFSPRHRHNFEQYRYVLDGELNYNRNGKLTKGMLGYFPEGVMYGPQSQDPDKFSLALILQFGGTSGSGFLSQPEVDAAEAELKKVGEFEKGVFRRTSGTGKKNMDGMQAIWEHVNGRPMVYPKPHLINPAFMDPAHYEWSKVDGASNVAEKLFAVSSDRGAESRIVKFEAGASHALRGRAVYYTLSGNGTVGSEPLRAMTSFYLDAGESVEITARETVEILQLGMPKLSGMTASVGQAAA